VDFFLKIDIRALAQLAAVAQRELVGRRGEEVRRVGGGLGGWVQRGGFGRFFRGGVGLGAGEGRGQGAGHQGEQKGSQHSILHQKFSTQGDGSRQECQPGSSAPRYPDLWG